MSHQQEIGGYNPPPPPDSNGVTWTGGFSSEAVFFIIISLLTVAMTVVVVVGVTKTAGVHKKFMAECIEFHSTDRCHELLRYGRTDLVRRN